EVSSETTIQVAAGNGGFYAVTTSFAAPNKPLPMEFNPRKVFVQLMGEGDTAAEREALLRKNASILDMIAERTQSLRARLGPADQARLSDYLDTVREIERRLAMASQRDLSNVDVPDAPVGVLDDFDAQVRMMFDLIALAYQADLTRVARSEEHTSELQSRENLVCRLLPEKIKGTLDSHNTFRCHV